MWQPLKSGIYSAKSGYHSTMALSLSKSPTDTVDWHKDVWSSSCSLKLKVFLYTILHNVLSLGENLLHLLLCEKVWNLIPTLDAAANQSFELLVIRFEEIVFRSFTLAWEHIAGQPSKFSQTLLGIRTHDM